MIVTGVDGGPLTLTVRKKDPVQKLKIKATGKEPLIGIQIKDDYGHFRWLSCIEAFE